MPLFMLVSGYLFYFSISKKTFKEMVQGRIQAIGIPILVWGTGLYLLDFMIAFVQNNG